MGGGISRPLRAPARRGGLEVSNLNERAGTRTQDPVIKSHMLYQLSYTLAKARQKRPREAILCKIGRSSTGLFNWPGGATIRAYVGEE